MNRIMYSSNVDHLKCFLKRTSNLALIPIVIAVLIFSSSSSYALTTICTGFDVDSTGSKYGPWAPEIPATSTTPDHTGYFTFYTPNVYSYIILNQIISTFPIYRVDGWIDHGFGVFVELAIPANKVTFYAAHGNTAHYAIAYDVNDNVIASVQVIATGSLTAYTLEDTVNNELISKVVFEGQSGGSYSEGMLTHLCADVLL